MFVSGWIRRSLRRGVTLTELIVVVAIIGILTTLIVPVAVNRSRQARVVAAQEDMRQLVDGLEACAAIHGYYVPLQVLDDQNMYQNELPAGLTVVDSIHTEFNPSQLYLIDPMRPVSEQAGGLQNTLNDITVPRIADMIQNWAGPFVEFRHVYEDPDIQPDQQRYVSYDYPLDPWGQPYRLYTPLGVAGGAQAQSEAVDPTEWGNGTIFTNELRSGGQDQRFMRFDRYALVSWGPDQRPDTQYEIDNKLGDDLYITFGGNYTQRSFNAFRQR
ncbi:MAG TPA: type II secretion system protein [Candidatus Sumerlaeota bacterium]|nr:type II secretion system protein [Candidatus Sumerlaeota bacterium]